MAIQLREISNWLCAVPTLPGMGVHVIMEPPGDKTPWLLLQQYAQVPEKGRSLFVGSLAVRNARHREFRNYVRQARSYWDAGKAIVGSASALPYYYSFLNLAKSELLLQPTNVISGTRIGHGLSYNPRGTDSIRSDYLTVTRGVFQELVMARTGVRLSNGTRLPVMNLLSQIPEIGLEMAELGRTRPRTTPALHVVASNAEEAWVLLAVVDGKMDHREPLRIVLDRHFDELDLGAFGNWRDIFAMSRRAMPAGLRVLQSKQTFSVPDASGNKTPAYRGASHFLRQCLGSHVSDPVGMNCDLLLAHSLKKSARYVLPLGLVRYAAMFYLSSLVRYKPSALDPMRQGAQAWLMDSFTREVPINVLASALTGVSGAPVLFEQNGYRV